MTPFARSGRRGGQPGRSQEARLCPRARAGRRRLNRQLAEARGRRAETLAAWWLRLQGWRILAQRARVPGGEVDLVARRGRVLAFVEVKQRAHRAKRPTGRWTNIACAGSQSPPSALRRAMPATATIVRIDALFIVPRRLPRHLPNVWHG